MSMGYETDFGIDLLPIEAVQDLIDLAEKKMKLAPIKPPLTSLDEMFGVSRNNYVFFCASKKSNCIRKFIVPKSRYR